MFKKISGYITTSIGFSGIILILGIILLIFPNMSMIIFSYSVASFLMIFGAISLIKVYKGLKGSSIKFIGLLSILIGLIIFVYPNSLISIVPIVLGIWMIFSSFPKLELAFRLKSSLSNKWISVLISASLGLICGIILLAKPNIFAMAITSLIGIIMIIYAINDICGLYFFKSNKKIIYNYFKK